MGMFSVKNDKFKLSALVVLICEINCEGKAHFLSGRAAIATIIERNRGYYMAARRYEISLRVLKNISRVSAATTLFISFFLP